MLGMADSKKGRLTQQSEEVISSIGVCGFGAGMGCKVLVVGRTLDIVQQSGADYAVEQKAYASARLLLVQAVPKGTRTGESVAVLFDCPLS